MGVICIMEQNMFQGEWTTDIYFFWHKLNKKKKNPGEESGVKHVHVDDGW